VKDKGWQRKRQRKTEKGQSLISRKGEKEKQRDKAKTVKRQIK
jgi:hypothetical protein